MRTPFVRNLFFIGILGLIVFVPALVGSIPTIINLSSNALVAFLQHWLVGLLICAGATVVGMILYVTLVFPLINLYGWCEEQAEKTVKLTTHIQKRTKKHEVDNDDTDGFDLTSLRSND